MLTLRRATPDDESTINAWYDSVRFAPSDFSRETLIVAERDGTRVGVGRLVPMEDGSVELGGMFVPMEHRKQGVAEAIVKRLLDEAGARTVWCIPFVHLRHFYERFGLRAHSFEAADVPDGIRRKARFCDATYDTRYLLLVRR